MNSNHLEQYFKGKRILITGNTGFKGSWLTLMLDNLGANIYGLASSTATSKNLISSISANYITKQFDCDIRDFSGLKKVFDEVKPEIVFHLAANALTLQAYEFPLQTIETNAMGTANVLENLRLSPHRVNGIIITSDKCYQNNEWVWGYRESDVLAGIDPYSASKSLAEIITNSYYNSFFKTDGRIKVCTCRAGNVIGGGDWSDDRIIPDCIKAWQEQSPMSLRNPNAIRPWNYVLDVLWGYLLASYTLDKGAISGESFNFGPSPQSEISVEKLTQLLWKYTPEPKGFKAFEISPNSNKAMEHQYLKLSSDKAASGLSWSSSFNIEMTAEQTALWYHTYFEKRSEIGDLSLKLVDNFISNRINQDGR